LKGKNNMKNQKLEKQFEAAAVKFAEGFQGDVERVKQAEKYLTQLREQRKHFLNDIEKHKKIVADADQKNLSALVGEGGTLNPKYESFLVERKTANGMIQELQRLLPQIDANIKEAEKELVSQQSALANRVQSVTGGPQAEAALKVVELIVEAVTIYGTWQRVARKICAEKNLPELRSFIEPNFDIAFRQVSGMPDASHVIDKNFNDISGRFIEGLRTCKTYLTMN